MKILHYVDEPDLAWRQPWVQLLSVLETLGVENVLICPSGGLLEESAREAGLACRSGKAAIPWLPTCCRRIGRVFREECPDIIHTRLSAAAFVGGVWGKKFGIPVVSTVDKYPKAHYYRNAEWIVGCSSAVSDHMAGLGFSRRNIVTIHNPVDSRSYQPDAAERHRIRQAEAVPEGALVFLGLGRFVDWKAFEVLIEACSRLRSRDDWQLWLVGDGPEREALVRRVQETNLGARTRFFGFAKDVRPFLWAADLFVQPSKEPEGFSLALLEAMAAGLTPVATDIGGTSDLLRPDRDGWIFRPGDVTGLTAILEKVLATRRERLAETSRNALSRAAEFDTAQVAQHTVDLYKAILSRAGGKN
ncbi:MAG: glycosyltransferase [Anaerolineales bacterium]|nr:glycosyltransferase [Anaerolineales bacterium]